MKRKNTIQAALMAALILALVFGYAQLPILAHEGHEDETIDTQAGVGGQEEADDLNQQIQETKEKLEELKKQAAIYQKNIRIKQEEAVSLQNQIEILNNKIAKTEIDIETTEEEIKKTELEVRETELLILEQADDIDDKKKDLGGTLQQIQKNDTTNLLEIFVLNSSIGEFFSEVENTKLLSRKLSSDLDDVKLLKNQLELKKEELDGKREELLKLEKQLALEKAELEGELAYKDNLLLETQESEDKFYNLYWQTKQEQNNANADIIALEKAMRAELEQRKDDRPALTDSNLIWPVPKNVVTAQFHDKGYPFRHIFEHPAIDIRAAQGTETVAAADGYVLRAKDAGMGYSYIAIIHADGLSTVYGHVSKIFVKEDEFVSKGEVIGLSGGMPGTPGAGNLTTGPHMHFEVRLDGIPVDPLLYLP